MARKEATFKFESGLKDTQLPKGEITESSLSPGEQELVEALLHWEDIDGLERVAQQIFEVFGRSLVVQSPDRPWGLQVIGLCGSLDAVHSGIKFSDKAPEFVISPVSDRNVAAELAMILETREIDDRGKVIAHQPRYAALRGMREQSAASRKNGTQKIQGIVDAYEAAGRQPPIIVPKLVAEGVLTNQKDDEDKSLAFQVYGVPLVGRLPSQILESFRGGTVKGLEYFLRSGHYVGNALRIFHLSSFSYGDSHLGNMSLIDQYDGKKALYTTDLGNVHFFGAQKALVQKRYQALDLAVALRSIHELVQVFHDLFKRDAKNSGRPLDPAVQLDNLFTTRATILLGGYFSPELDSNQITHDNIFSIAQDLKPFIVAKETQGFVDKCAGLLARHIKV